ncbi:MAG: DUF4255 domain-containing protein [Candidatus Bathyarchaeota archaeon]|nr:DUF4255 domain-containing protein [Candidatus Bathyarchaeota archaeon]
MSSHTNIQSATATLIEALWQSIHADPVLKLLFRSSKQISAFPPRDIQSKDPHLSVYLYRVTENLSLRNQPQTPQSPRTLLYLNLQYLITPLTQKSEDDQLVLGKVLQLFSGKPVFRGADLQGDLGADGGDLRITLDALGLEDLSRLWLMLGSSHKTSLSYTVSPVCIKPAILEKMPPVRLVDKRLKK